MKKILIVLLLSIHLFLPISTFAQEVVLEEDNEDLTTEEEQELFEEDRPAEISDVTSLRAEFNQNTQSPKSKIVKFEMILKSNIDSDRVKITWSVSGKSRVADETQLEKVITVKKGESYTIPIEIIPTGDGVSEVFGKAQAFGVANNVVATVRKNYASNASGEILPLTDEYKTAKNINIVLTIIIIVAIVGVVLGGGFFISKRVVKWYDADERAKYEDNSTRG